MKALIVFDALGNIEDIQSVLMDHGVKEADVFSLADSTVTLFESAKSTDRKIAFNCLDSIELIEEQFDNVCAGINAWSAALGECVVGALKVKEWFLLPHSNLSTWWLSLLSEKNTLKTKVFLQIAQLRAINNLFKRKQYIFCAILISEKMMRRAIISLARNFCGPMRIHVFGVKENSGVTRAKAKYFLLGRKHDTFIPRVEIRGFPLRIKSQIKNSLQECGILGNGLLGLGFGFQFLWRGFLARRFLDSYRSRLPSVRTLFLVTYSAVIEDRPENVDRLINKYDPVLQKKIEELNIPLAWLLLYVPLRDRDFRNFIRRAKSFKQSFFIPEEFFTSRMFLKCLFLWIRQASVGRRLLKRLNRAMLLGEPVTEESEILIRSLWMQSFFGAVGMSGIIHYFVFREIFAKVPNISDCLYYCEMQSWEKALNAAKNYISPHVRSIGFQHSTVPKNLFNLFCDKKEAAASGKVSDLPLPDVLACNGFIPFSILSESGYPGLVKAEATRYAYLNNIFSSPRPAREDRPVLLVVGSSDKVESRALLALVNAAFPKVINFDIRFKSHVCLPLEKIFEEHEIEPEKAGYRLCDEGVSECLAHAWAVLVPSSSIAIEALAFGCEVIIPFFPNAIAINPLIDYPGFYHKVKTAQDLNNVVLRIFSGYSLKSADEYSVFVKNYWYLENALPRWKEILTGNNPLVSVIVATYNRAHLISQSIESILGQSYPYLELIIVSDGSTDETESLVRSFSDSRIRFIKLDHTGIPAIVRNRGIKEAQGKYIAFCDDDDLWLKDKLEKQIAFMESCPDIGLCFGYAILFEDTRYNGTTSHLFNKKVAMLEFRELFLDNTIPCLTVMVRKRCLETVGVFDENPELRQAAEDYDLWLRIARSYKVARIPEVLSRYRTHADNISKEYDVTCVKYLKVMEKFISQGAIDKHTICKRKSNIFLLAGNALLARNNDTYKEFYKKSICNSLSIRSVALSVFCLLPKALAFYSFVFCRKMKISLYRIKMSVNAL